MGGARLLRTLAVVLLVLALVGLGTGGALLATATSAMRRVDVEGLARAGGRMNVLVVGSDSRDGLSDEQLQQLGTEAVEGRRTDSIFLLSARGGSAAMLSFPRDLFVQRCDGTQGRINGAYSQGGPSCLVQTVSEVSGIPVTHYLEIDFAGFIGLVDAVGGVQVFLEAPLVDVPAGVDLPAGCSRLDGRQAIGFVRARGDGGDLGRIARQQRFLKELVEEVASLRTLVDVPRLFAVARSAGAAVTADRGFGPFDLLRLARAGRGLAGGGLATYTVASTPQEIGGAAVLVPTDGAGAVFSRFADGSILDVPPQPEVGPQPADVEVDVLNAAGVAGLAGRGRDLLLERGFRVGQVENAPSRPATVVLHAPGFEAQALLVASQLDGVGTQLSDAGGPRLALVIGQDTNLRPAPPPSPADPAPPPPPPAGAAAGAAPVPADC